MKTIPMTLACVLVALCACKDKARDARPSTQEEATRVPSQREEASDPEEEEAAQETTAREMVDTVGYCIRADQLEQVIETSRKLEADRLEKTASAVKAMAPFAALCPHDDHLYSARVALHVIPFVARADTVIVLGVTHRTARQALGDPQDRIILDDFQDWISAEGHVPVDRSLRQAIADGMEGEGVMVSRLAHQKEHSIEGLLPLLKHFNPDVRVVPIMVTAMQWETMENLSGALADVVVSYARENEMQLGRDLSVLVSVDAVHYGPDFSHSPFGTDEQAHEEAVARDRELGQKYLAGGVTGQSVREFASKVWGDEIPWCGRYSVPFGLLFSMEIARELTGRPLTGLALRYGDSHTLGALPDAPEGLGTTAPASLEHWVGYWAILYGTVTSETDGTRE